MKFLWRYSQRYKATHLDLMKRFWAVSPLVIIPYSFFSGYANEISQSCSKKWLLTSRGIFSLEIVGKKSVTDLFSRNQFRFNQFLSISFKVILLFPFHELKLFILQKSSSKTSESFPKKPFSNSSKRRFPKNHPSNFTFKFFLLSKFDLFSFPFRFQNPFPKISKERNDPTWKFEDEIEKGEKVE